MKCKLHFDSFGHVNNLPDQADRVKHFKRGGTANHAPLPAGTIIDHPDAWMLVHNGHAEPADDECKLAANMTQSEMDEAKASFKKRAMGRTTGIKKYDGKPPAAEQKSLADDAA